MTDAKHEAPAEGEGEGELVERLEALDNGTASEKPWVAVALAEEAAKALRARSSAPEAREDYSSLIAARCVALPGKLIDCPVCLAVDDERDRQAAPSADKLRIAVEAVRDSLKCEGPEHKLIYQRDRAALDRIATGSDLRRAIVQALAALKAEGA